MTNSVTSRSNEGQQIYSDAPVEAAVIKGAKQGVLGAFAEPMAESRVEVLETTSLKPGEASVAKTASVAGPVVNQLSTQGQFVAGGMTGAGNTVFRPFDKKGVQQVVNGKEAVKVTRIVSREAWVGAGLACGTNVASFGVLLGTQPAIRTGVRRMLGDQHPYAVDATTGLCASSVQVLLIGPLSVIQTKSDATHKSPKEVFMEIMKLPPSQCLPELYRGRTAMMARNGVHTGVAIPVIDFYRGQLKQMELLGGDESRSLRLINGTCAGALAGMTGVLLSLPVDNYAKIRTAAGPKPFRERVQHLMETGPYSRLGFTMVRMGISYGMMGLATEFVFSNFPSLQNAPSLTAPKAEQEADETEDRAPVPGSWVRDDADIYLDESAGPAQSGPIVNLVIPFGCTMMEHAFDTSDVSDVYIGDEDGSDTALSATSFGSSPANAFFGTDDDIYVTAVNDSDSQPASANSEPSSPKKSASLDWGTLTI